ncbi:MAG: outer membrane lipoprotein-sorting protein [Candidatus Bipolaricaulia bacterium]
MYKKLMRRAFCLVLLAVLGLALLVLAQDQSPDLPSDQEILEQADRARFIDADSYVMEIAVAAERPEEEPREALFKVYVKKFEDGIRQRVEFLEPEDYQNTVYLVIGDDIYFYQFGHGLPSPLRISGQQRLFGDAGVAEAAGILFANNYRIASREETQLDDQPSLLLHLESETAAYRLVDLWVEPATFRPQQAVLYALSEQPLRQILYEKYAALDGDGYAGQMVVKNLLQEGHRTTLEITEVSIEELPDELFDPASLHD